MVRVLLVDDEELVRVALRAVLDSAPDIEAVACDGPEAVGLARSAAPDVVLLDVNMPGEDGFSVLRELRALPEPPPVAMLTLMGSDEYLDAALRFGACGYLLKDTEPHLLIDCVRILARGGVVYVPPRSRSVMGVHVGAPRPAPVPAGLRDLLTGREQEVLALLAAGLTNTQLAGRLGVGVTTVKTHIGSLKRKLNAPSRVAIAAIAHREGLSAVSPAEAAR
ncbi:response regulator transcription factor [Streptomyces sp. NPDC002138]|uniref:response regulator transcription factor n=1 Tax=Streptomyces sp. NPDC002138 TaxID=3154410 RepID=UPI00333332D7